MKERKLGLLGQKVGMTQIYDEKSQLIGVTVLQVGPCLVMRKRTKAATEKGSTDGYTALQLGYGAKKAKRVTKPEEGTLKAAGGTEKARQHVRELRVSDATLARFEVGQEISLKDLEFNVGDLVDVVGRSKGRGFQGVMKRFHFKGFNASHGTHEYFRHGGSIGCRKWPGRVMKGRSMPGHMGDKNTTTQNLRVAQVRADENLLLVQGAVPGAKNGYVVVRLAVKKHPTP